ncbi:hypothetical protein V5N11_032351 [Cardamine amara subsp. amara]|uniref:Reverse transcriptase zinc-binding domain-containing protein n=1 Tax=Cardamine amara subsp. amara TaxID=228776 RepID=A0ABD1BRC8_CARAN
MGEVYNKLKGPGVDVPWGNIVWNKGGIPKHNFLTWLFVLNRCPTRDRFLGWGLPTASDCLLCNTMPESRDHLFFDCSHSWSVWLVVASRCGLIAERMWVRSLVQLQMLSGRKEKKRLTVLAWKGTIHALWTERNARLHRNFFRSTDSLLAQIDLTIRNRIASYRQVNQTLASSMLQLWFMTAS